MNKKIKIPNQLHVLIYFYPKFAKTLHEIVYQENLQDICVTLLKITQFLNFIIDQVVIVKKSTQLKAKING